VEGNNHYWDHILVFLVSQEEVETPILVMVLEQLFLPSVAQGSVAVVAEWADPFVDIRVKHNLTKRNTLTKVNFS
jgi:hypothetical protein